jgi:hypothetical protein
MGLFSQKPVDRKININEGYVLDRPKVDAPLIDVTKSVWFDRGYGVTNWRDEGIDSYHVKIGNLANEDGSLIIEPIRTSEILGFQILSEYKRRHGWRSTLEATLGIMIKEGKIRLVSPYPTDLTFYHLTLTRERQPALIQDIVSIPILEYPSTKECLCSDAPEDLFLKCEICKKILSSVVRSFYGDFWLEFEAAVIRRTTPEDPAIFDQAKVPMEIRDEIKTSIAYALCLCAKSWKSQSHSQFDRAQRLSWIRSYAQGLVQEYINPVSD